MRDHDMSVTTTSQHQLDLNALPAILDENTSLSWSYCARGGVLQATARSLSVTLNAYQGVWQLHLSDYDHGTYIRIAGDTLLDVVAPIDALVEASNIMPILRGLNETYGLVVHQYDVHAQAWELVELERCEEAEGDAYEAHMANDGCEELPSDMLILDANDDYLPGMVRPVAEAIRLASQVVQGRVIKREGHHDRLLVPQHALPYLQSPVYTRYAEIEPNSVVQLDDDHVLARSTSGKRLYLLRLSRCLPLRMLPQVPGEDDQVVVEERVAKGATVTAPYTMPRFANVAACTLFERRVGPLGVARFAETTLLFVRFNNEILAYEV